MVESKDSILVSRLRQTEKALQESEKRYRNLVKYAPAGIYEIDIRGGKFLDVNDLMCEFLGYTREELLAMKAEKLLDKEGRKHFRERMRKLLKGEKISRQPEYKIRCKDGKEMWCLLNVTVNFDGETPKTVSIIANDITDRKFAEIALQESELLYRTLFNSIDEGFCIIEVLFDERKKPLDYRFLILNPAFERQTGLKGAEGSRILELVPKIEKFWIDTYGHIALTGEPVRFQNYSRQLSGWYDVYAFRFGNPENHQVAILFNNITDRKKAEAQILELNRTLEQRVSERTEEIQKLADQLRALANRLSETEQRERKRLALVLHDNIQQLITAARFKLSLISRDGKEDNPGKIAREADEILLETLEELHNLTLETSPPILFDAGLIPALNWLVSHKKERYGFKIFLFASSQAEPATEAIRLFLFKSTRELVFNAIKHSGKNEATIKLTRLRNGQIKLTVSDRGQGFDSDFMEKRTAEDTTFGLFSVQQRISYLGGKMKIDSGPGKGTRISLTLPDHTPE